METSLVTAQRPAPEAGSGAYALADYPEFRAPGGNRYLKKLLRQIVPMALYRTWEIFTDHQARGNDCYLSLSQLAALAGRSVRTMQKNGAFLQARHLLVERVERKQFQSADGHTVSRLVVVKDFTALYALAHDYHEWLQSEEMIPPERPFVSLLVHDAALMAKLQRFDNYRRVLLRYVPLVSTHEEDYGLADNAQTSEQRESPPLRATTLAAKEVSKEMSKETPKRINESSQRDVVWRDSFDSAPPSSISLVKGRNEGPQGHHHQFTRRSGQETPKRTPQTSPQQSAMLTQPIRPEQALSHRHTPSEYTPEAMSPMTQGKRGARARANQRTASRQRNDRVSEGSVACPQPPEHALARSFLNTIAVPFGDRNPKGSATRFLNILAHASLEEEEVVLCLVRAYTIARDTRTIHSAHSEPATGQTNRMPLFCTLFERFAQARLHNDKWDYSWQQLENDLARDDLLFAWWTEQQTHLTQKSPGLPAHHTPLVSGTPEDQGEDPPLIMGWARREAAQYWGEQLLETLILVGYEAEVRVHLEDQWYQLILIGEDCEWVLDTSQKVRQVIKHVRSELPSEDPKHALSKSRAFALLTHF